MLTAKQFDAAAKYNAGRADSEDVTKLTYIVQQYFGFKGKDLDGQFGPKTKAAVHDAVGRQGPQLPSNLVWPMHRLGGPNTWREPKVTSGFKHPARPNHVGADLFYPYHPALDPPMKVGDGGRTTKWWVPDDGMGSAAYAVADGVVEMAGWRPTGYRVWIDIGDYSVGYFHLSDLKVKVGQKVQQGQPIGTIGHNPVDTDAKHLHFELHEGDLDNYPKGLVDPMILLDKARHW